MVHLTLSPHRGNSSRAFPYTGLFGLTPITVQGVLRTKLDADHKPLDDATAIVVRVRCYHETSSVGPTAQRVRLLYEVAQTVWTPPEGAHCAPVAELERSFRLVVPVDARKQGALSSLSFKLWRVFWTVDGVIHHRPSSLYGDRVRKSHPIHLTDHALPPTLPPLPVWTSSPAPAGGCSYRVEASSSLCGAGDALSVAVALHSNVRDVKRVVVELHREKLRAEGSPSAPTTSPGGHPLPSRQSSWPFQPAANDASPSVLRRITIPTGLPTPDSSVVTPDGSASSSESASAGYFALPVTMPLTPPSSTDMTKWRREDVVLASVSRDLDGTVDSTANVVGWSGKLELTVPATRTAYHYSVGETCATSDLYIRAYLCVRIVLRNKTVIDLAPQDVHLAPVSVKEREAAMLQLGRIAVVQAAEAKLFGGAAPRSASASRSKAPAATKLAVPASSAQAATARVSPSRSPIVTPPSPRPSLRRRSEESDTSSIDTTRILRPRFASVAVARHAVVTNDAADQALLAGSASISSRTHLLSTPRVSAPEMPSPRTGALAPASDDDDDDEDDMDPTADLPMTAPPSFATFSLSSTIPASASSKASSSGNSPFGPFALQAPPTGRGPKASSGRRHHHRADRDGVAPHRPGPAPSAVVPIALVPVIAPVPAPGAALLTASAPSTPKLGDEVPPAAAAPPRRGSRLSTLDVRRKSSSGLRFIGDALRRGSRGAGLGASTPAAAAAMAA